MSIKACLAVAFCLSALCGTASAGTISLSFSGSADCPAFDFCDDAFGESGPYYVGDLASGWGTILQVTGPGGQSPVISAGSLGFTMAPSPDGYSYWGGDEWGNSGSSGAGGGFIITGSVFGLDPGSTLLSGTFQWGWCSAWFSYHGYGESCYSGIQTDYVNPALLQGLGLQPNLAFVGSLTGLAQYEIDEGGSSQVDVDLVATPESNTLLLLLIGSLLSLYLTSLWKGPAAPESQRHRT
ncbi:MAG TPA: hypothetical protein VMO17_14765 [Terriglobia bacterium]|nr:hypothetical protein [Terriglobia bacterium]